MGKTFKSVLICNGLMYIVGNFVRGDFSQFTTCWVCGKYLQCTLSQLFLQGIVRTTRFHIPPFDAYVYDPNCKSKALSVLYIHALASPVR